MAASPSIQAFRHTSPVTSIAGLPLNVDGKNLSAKDAETARALFEEERKIYRHRNEMCWSRIKVIALIEGAVFYVLLSMLSHNAELLKALFLVPLVFVLVLLFSVMAYKDGSDADFYLKRAARIGEQLGLPHDDQAHRAEILVARDVMLVVLNLYNAYLVWMTWSLVT